MKLAIVAGEASGDLHAAEVVRELRRRDSAISIFGIGGDLLAGEGVRLLHHAREMGIVGLFNVIRHLGMFRRIFHDLLEALKRERPDAILLVDYPDFNLRVARKCRRLGIPVIYYISPQLWAWRKGRVHQIARNVDLMIVIFPFEASFYQKHNVKVVYVGHPLIEELEGVARPASKGDFSQSGRSLRLALMPGSRRMEVASLLPPMLEAVEILRRERPVDAFVIQAPTISEEQLRNLMAGAQLPIVSRRRSEALAQADLALSSSGTATLESAVLGTPVVVMYKLQTATYWMATFLVKLPDFSLVNIIAGKRVVPELIQGQVTGVRMASEVRSLMEPERYERVLGDLEIVRARLGGPGASARAAEEILRMLDQEVPV